MPKQPIQTTELWIPEYRLTLALAKYRAGWRVVLTGENRARPRGAVALYTRARVLDGLPARPARKARPRAR